MRVFSRWPALVAVFFVVLFVACAQGERDFAPTSAPPSATSLPTDPPPKDPGDNTNPDEAMPPIVSSVSPNKATVGSVGPSIIVSGDNFVPRSIVQLDGAPLATTFVSSTELRATIPTGKLASVGTLRISVGTSPPGGGASKEIPFAVENPVPALTQIAPLSVLAGSPATTLHATGTGFVSGAKVFFGATELSSTLVSDTAIDATIPANLLQSSGSFPVKIVNPAPGGGDSPPIAFTVSNPSAAIQSINPASAFVGSAGFQMTVIGGGFVSGSSVLFNGTALTTTFVNQGELRAQVPAASLTAAGDFPVAVANPPPGGGVSAPVAFRVQYPVPQATSLSPSSASAGSGPTEVIVTGVGFFVTTQITFDNAPAATTYVDSTHVKATLTASQLATAGSIAVRVVNPMPGGGTSSALAFEVRNGVPAITALNPSTVTAGSPDRAITIHGQGFVASSTVRSNGQTVATSYVSGSQLEAMIPANHLLNPGTVAITVTNPAPGGGTSAASTLTVGCDTTGATVLLHTVDQIRTFILAFESAPLMSRFLDSSSCATTVIDPNNQEPARYLVVQNTTGVPVTLSAWAYCQNTPGIQEDAYLTFYKRPTIPASDVERLACTGHIAEGIAVSGFASPESGSSAWCPGLTKANGGGLPLGVCEKAVVHIQAYDASSTAYPPPAYLRLVAE